MHPAGDSCILVAIDCSLVVLGAPHVIGPVVSCSTGLRGLDSQYAHADCGARRPYNGQYADRAQSRGAVAPSHGAHTTNNMQIADRSGDEQIAMTSRPVMPRQIRAGAAGVGLCTEPIYISCRIAADIIDDDGPVDLCNAPPTIPAPMSSMAFPWFRAQAKCRTRLTSLSVRTTAIGAAIDVIINHRMTSFDMIRWFLVCEITSLTLSWVALCSVRYPLLHYVARSRPLQEQRVAVGRISLLY